MTKNQCFEAISIDEPKLPDWVEQSAFTSGGYPYQERMKRKKYEAHLKTLQIELLKVQSWLRETDQRAVIVFEGLDAAGKGGTILRLRQHLNPRNAHVVALTKPTASERGEWYFQRYIRRLPTAGDLTIFDRSWYNRAVVEPVMGFCTPAETEKFLIEAPKFEKMLVDEGIILVKLWLNVGREMQLRRLHKRRHDPLKQWKLSPIDIKGIALWKDYIAARDRMFKATHTLHAPWISVKSNDKMRARLNVIGSVLNRFDYGGNRQQIDPLIVGGPDLVMKS